MNKKCVLFDLDGTLLDTTKDLINAVNFALRKNGLKELPGDEIIFYTGNGVKVLCENASRENPALFPEVFKDFKEYYDVHCLDNTCVYEGIEELVFKLRQKGLKTAVISNKADEFVKEIINKNFKAGTFDFVMGGRDNISLKPSREMLDFCLKEIGMTLDESIYVGDSEVDILTSLNTKMDLIVVSYGFRKKEYLLGINKDITIVDSVKELESLLLG